MRTWINRLALSLVVVVAALLAATAPFSTKSAHGAMPAENDQLETPIPSSTTPPSAGTSYRIEAEAMTLVGSAANVVSDPAASGGAAVKAWTDSSGVGGSATFSASGAYAFTVGGREDYYGGTDGAHAHVSLYLDGATTPAGGVSVTNSSGYLPYTITVPLSAGTHSFQLLYDDDAYGGSSATDRNVYIDDVGIAPATGAPGGTPLPAQSTATSTPLPAQSTATSTPLPTPLPAQSTATSTPPPANPTVAPGAAPISGHAIKTVFLIVMENEDWSSIKNNSSAPYINGTLLPMASHAEQYYTPPNNHPSLTDYLWLEAGTNFGITNDNPPSSNPQSTTSHLVSLLNNAGISWKAFEEGISGSRCPLTDSYPYAVRHDPFVYFNDVTNNQSSSSSYCIAHVRPYTELATDLANNTVARYNFITPNVCNDMHDSCGSDPIKQGDTWLSTQVPRILNSQAYKNGGALFITWDEGGGGSDGPIGMIVLSPYARGHGYANAIPYTHSSTLRTLQEIFGVSPWLGDAANATDLRDLFSTFP